jgi:hypothetical protein
VSAAGVIRFRMNPVLLAAITRQVNRASGFLPATDIPVLCALHCLASRLPRRVCIVSEHGIPEVEIPFRQADLLSSLAYERAVDGGDAGTFPSSSRRTVRASLCRLTTNELSFDLKVDVRDAYGRIQRVPGQFSGPLVSRLERSVVLHCYSPPGSRYFSLVPDHLLRRMRGLDETALRLIPWLYYRHRGRREEGRLVHRKEVSLPEALLVDLGLFNPHRPEESRRRIRRALDSLVALGMLSIEERDYSNVTLLPAYFRERPGE